MNGKYLLTLFLGVLLGTMSLTISPAQSSGIVQVYSVEWSRDGSRFVTVTDEGLTIYDNAFVELVYQGFPTGPAFEIPSIALSTNGERIYVGRRKVNPAIIDTTPLQQYCDTIWTASVCETHVILDTENLELVVNLSDVSVLPYTAQWSLDGLSIAFRSEDDRSTMVYSAVDGTLLQSFSPPPLIWGIGYEGGVEWSPNNLYFARAGGDQLFILNASTGEIVSQHQFETETILDLVWSPDSTQIAILTTAEVAVGTLSSFSDPNTVSGARRNSIIVFDPSTSTIISQISEPAVSAALSWSPDGDQLAAEGGRGRIYIWDAMSSDLLDSFQMPPYLIRNLSYSPYGGRLMVAQNTAAPVPSMDPDFVPISSYVQPELGGIVQFVAPSASVENLSTILVSCAVNSEIVTTGLAFLTAQQYNEFINWLDQQPSSVISKICAADLRIIALTIVNAQPSPLPTFTPTPLPTCDTTILTADTAPLISAITAANNAGTPQTICLSEGTYTLTSVDHSADGPNGLPSISGDVTLVGLGSGATIIRDSGAPNFRILRVAGNGRLALENITISGGNPGGSNNGGGVRNLGTLELVNSTVEYNTARDGAGIRNNNNATLITTNSIIRNNTSPTSGGGLFSNSGSSTTLVDTRFEANIASASSGSTATLMNVTIA